VCETGKEQISVNGTIIF